MKKFRMAIWAAAGIMLATSTTYASAQGEKDGQGQTIITVLPKHKGDSAAVLNSQDLKIKVNGKDGAISHLVKGIDSQLEMVVLIDGSARTSIGRQMDDLKHFILSLPPNSKSAVAYMENGNANFAGPLSTDRNQVIRGLHLPNGMAGSNASPYFCLYDLAK